MTAKGGYSQSIASWLLTPESSRAAPFSSSSVTHLGKLIRKPGFSFLECQWEKYKLHEAWPRLEPSSKSCPIKYNNKSWSQAKHDGELLWSLHSRDSLPVWGQRGLHNKFQTSQTCLKISKQSKPTPLPSQPFPDQLCSCPFSSENLSPSAQHLLFSLVQCGNISLHIGNHGAGYTAPHSCISPLSSRQ